ncbi:MAG: radical SAM family heme chaperone HemW, partial [Acidimicrobiia bacterium]|nr:radical SAM family heme chaperone HemW [Acidimicrobiia bacterium]
MDDYARRSGAYIHIPFCSAVCPYCDFAVVAGRDDAISRYCAAVVAEIEQDLPWRPLDAVYFGGGTPSRAPVAELESVLLALRDRHGITAGAEVSLEANPEDFTSAVASSLFQAGFNRVSFGAQSFDSRVLQALGRRHRPEQIGESVSNARLGGFENVSVDLIYGTPEETDESWRDTVRLGLEFGPDHVSCYALTVEPGTELGRQVTSGAPAPDPDTQVDRFLIADEMIRAAGMERYEVSNWARPGYECAYNSIVWAQGEYLAYGNGGHRFRDGVRSRNVRRLDTYLDRVESGAGPEAGSETIAGWDREIDRLFVGLRRVSGVAVGPGVTALLQS